MSSLFDKANSRKYLIINADDFGYCPKRDRAIIDLFREKLISSTSLLINGDHARQACLLAIEYNLPMGLHLNLTEGRPITDDLSQIRSLVNSNGLMHGKIGLRDELNKGKIDITHIEYEIKMQLNKYREFTHGQCPIHIDGHQHIHIHPLVVESVARLAQIFGIKYIRIPDDRIMKNSFGFYREILDQTNLAREIFDKYSLIYPQLFFGISTMGKQFTLENIEACLQMFAIDNKNKIQVAELMCHPGYPSDPNIGGCGTGQPDEFSQSYQRQYEFDMLSSIEFKELFNKYHIQLGTYHDIEK